MMWQMISYAMTTVDGQHLSDIPIADMCRNELRKRRCARDCRLMYRHRVSCRVLMWQMISYAMTTVDGQHLSDIPIADMCRNELRKRLRRLRLNTKGKFLALKLRLARWRLAHPSEWTAFCDDC